MTIEPYRGARPFCGVAVMAKASRAGRTKTRLVPPLTAQEAAEFNTAFLQDIAANLLAAAETTSLAGYIAYAPAGSEAFFRDILPPGIECFETAAPDFGDCLFKAMTRLFERGHGGACLLNSDSPTLPTAILTRAAAALAMPGDRVVFGPSNDGGYYLIGCKRPHRRLFQDIAWSTDIVARQTLERAAELGVPVVMLPEWYDVDDAASLDLFAGQVLEGRPYGPADLDPFAAPRSAALLRGLLADPAAARRLALGSGAPADA